MSQRFPPDHPFPPRAYTRRGYEPIPPMSLDQKNRPLRLNRSDDWRRGLYPDADPNRTSSPYLCQLCGGPAEWPRLKVRRVGAWIFSTNVAWQTPMVCSTCRIMRQHEVTALGDGRRRFWKRVFALWDGQAYPTMGYRMRSAVYLRHFIPQATYIVAQNVWWIIRGPARGH